jgi:DNA (cytosine-5)-methyltransferase 1
LGVFNVVSDKSILETMEVSSGSVSRILNAGGFDFRTSIRLRSEGETPWDNWWLSYLNGGLPNFLSGKLSTLRSVDLFSSAGGLSLGVSQAALALGFKLQSQLAADLDGDALATYKANFQPSHLVNKSVRSLIDFQVLGDSDSAELAYEPVALAEASEIGSGVNVIMGGPPCQGHSSLNNHTRGKDVRNDLYLTLPALAIALNSETVIIENVPRVVHDYGRVVRSSIKVLKDAGYFVTEGVLSADDFGWPQTRSRHFLIASRRKQPMDLQELKFTFGREARPLNWLLRDIEDKFDPNSLFDSVPTLSLENQKRIEWLFENDAYELANHVRPVCHQEGHTYPSVYGRLHANKPSPTITTGFQSPGRGRYIHPTQPRVITAHEAARIQGFPDGFKFEVMEGKKLQRSHFQKWIGDAVPSILGYMAGLVAIETLV